jgi:hypothetical protein
MSGLWLNLRLGVHHIQIGQPNWYSIRVIKNTFYNSDNKPKHFIEFYR